MIVSGFILIDSPVEMSLSREKFTLAAITFFIMGISAATVTRWGHSKIFLWVQLLLDTVFVSLLVASELSPQSPFFVLYCINILGAVRLLSLRGVMIVAILDCSAFVFVSWLGVMGYLNWLPLTPLIIYWNTIARIFGLLLVGVLCVSLASQQTATQKLLTQQVKERVQIVKVHEDLLNQLPIGLLAFVQGKWFPQNDYAGKWLTRVPELEELLSKNKSRLHFELSLPDKETHNLLEFRRLNLERGDEVFLFQDVTIIREIERQAIHEDRLAAVGRLAASLAHEIRNPLGALSGSVQLLADKEESKLLSIILREVNRIDVLVKKFLLSSRPPEIERSYNYVHSIINNVVEAFMNDPINQHLNVNLDLRDGEVELFLDADQFYQVLLNILLNAAHATHNKGDITLGDKLEQREWIIWVKDDGFGIPASNINKIFDPFYTTRSGGTGLGLANVERIIKAHRGRVWVESEEEKGTTFYCALPLPRGEYGESQVISN